VKKSTKKEEKIRELKFLNILVVRSSLLVKGCVLSVMSLGLAVGDIHIRSVDVLVHEFLAVLLAGDGSRVVVQDIDLLERKTLGLGDAEVGEDETSQAGRSPDEEHLDAKGGISGTGVDEVRGGVTDTEIPEPVGGGGEGHGLGADVEGEDLGGDDPCDGAPGGGEEGDVDTDEGDESLLAGLVLDGDGDTDDGDEVFADEHAKGTEEQETTTSDTVNGPHSGNGHSDVDDVGGDRDDEGVLDAGVLEESRAVVEDEVDTGKLLPSLEEDTSKDTETDLVLAAPEAIEVAGTTKFLLLPQIRADVVKLNLNIGVGSISRKGRASAR